MGSLEQEIAEIGRKIEKEKEWQKVYKLFSEMMSKLENIREEEVTKNVNEFAIGNIVSVISKCRDFYKGWVEKEINPADEELDNVEKLAGEILDLLDGKFKKEDFPSILGDNYFSSASKSMEDIKERVREEKALRKYPSDNGGGNQPPPLSSDSNLEIASLQSQIKALEEKVKNDPNTNQVDKQKIQDLKNLLKEKQKETDKGKNKKNDFPTGLVVGGGIVIFILLVVFIFLLGRNSKNK